MTAGQVAAAASRIIADTAGTPHCENVEALDCWAAAVADHLHDSAPQAVHAEGGGGGG